MTNLPVSGDFEITAEFGRKGQYWKNGHKGVDFSGRYKREVYNVCDGTVSKVGYDGAGWGNYVIISDSARAGVTYIFAHLSAVSVKVGQSLNRASKIGVMGTSGNSSGIHLHFEMQVDGVATASDGYTGVPNAVGKYNSKNYPIAATTPSVPVPATPSVTYLRVATNTSPLWLCGGWNGSKPTTNIVRMPKGAEVELLERTNGSWYKVRYNGTDGYASAQYLK